MHVTATCETCFAANKLDGMLEVRSCSLAADCLAASGSSAPRRPPVTINAGGAYHSSCRRGPGLAAHSHRQPRFSVTNASKVVYGQGLQCAGPGPDANGSGGGGGCKPMDLLLDTYSPAEAPAGTPRPAVIMMHGGGWTGGSRTDGWARASSVFYASRCSPQSAPRSVACSALNATGEP